MSAEIIFDEPWEAYIKSGHHGSSCIHAFGDGMSVEEWYQTKFVGGYSNEPSKFKTLGGALDALVTGGQKFEECYAVELPEHRSPNKGGALCLNDAGKAYRAENVHKEFLPDKDFSEVKAAQPMAREALDVLAMGHPIRFQVTLRGSIEGFAVQDRPDAWIDMGEDGIEIPDLKYTSKMTSWERDFVGSREWYQFGIRWIFAKEIVAPLVPSISALLVQSGTIWPMCEMLSIDAEILDAAERDVRERCRKIKAALTTEGGLTNIVKYRPLTLPGWARQKAGL